MSLQIMPEYVDYTGERIPESFTEQDDMFRHGPMPNTADLSDYGSAVDEDFSAYLDAAPESKSTFWMWAPWVALAVGYWWLNKKERWG